MTTFQSNIHEEEAVVIEHDDVSDYNPAQLLPQPPQEIKKIRSWLQATDYAHASGEYRKHLSSHMPGTSSWVTSSTTYREWLTDSEHKTLWIKGIPGSGKSVVAAHLIDSLSKCFPGQPVLYFFFRQIIDANHEPAALLRDWLDQILEFSPPLQEQLKELIDSHRSLNSLSMEDMWRHLALAIANLAGQAFCVVDALDEMDQGHDDFLRSLASFGSHMRGKTKVIMTSRPTPSIELSLRLSDITHLRLEEKLVDVDISSYVESGLRMSQLPIADRDLVRDAIPGHANGIFLYARLAMDSFLTPGASAEAVLHALPVDLHEMYTSLLREHASRSGVSHDIQLLILQWVTHAGRPLRLLELAEIIQISIHQGDKSDPPLNIKNAKALIRAAAGPLLEILPNETVCVIHHSFTEYLRCDTRLESEGGYPILRHASTHGRLALTCVEYLLIGCLDTVVVSTSDDEEVDSDSGAMYERTRAAMYYGRKSGLADEEQRIRLQYPFYAYAAAHWHLHVDQSCAATFPQAEINLALERLFMQKNNAKAWLKLQWGGTEGDSRGVTPLHIAARFGLTDFAQHLQPEQANVDAVDALGRTSLWWAATSGHAKTIQFLILAGADPDAHEKVRGLKPLHEAASNNHANAVRVLLGAGVNPLTPKMCESPGRTCGNAARTRGHTPLMVGICSTDTLCSILIDFSTHATTATSSLWKPFYRFSPTSIWCTAP